MKTNLNSDYEYYNIIVNNTNVNSIPAEFRETRQEIILENQEDWLVGVVRYKIPSTLVPIFVFEPDSYYIGFSIGDNNTEVYKQVVVYDNKHIDVKPTSEDKFIYYYTSFLEMINKAIAVLFDQVKLETETTYPALLNGFDHPPYFVLDDTTPFIKLILPFDNDSLSPPCPFEKISNVDYINIHFSDSLLRFFAGFRMRESNSILSDKLTHQFTITRNEIRNNIITLPQFGNAEPSRQAIQLYQDYSTLYLWSTFSRLIIATSSLSIDAEQIAVKGSNGVPFSQTMITDFEIQANANGSNRDYIYYFTEKPRYYNFTGNGQLRNIDVRIYFQTKDLDTYLLNIPTGFEMSIKLQFKRRKAHDLLQYSKSGNIHSSQSLYKNQQYIR